MKISTGTYFDNEIVIICDQVCSKAWGITDRPCLYLDGENGDKDPDNYVYYADGELPDAPADPGTIEGTCRKPKTPEGIHNKWCVRQCERSIMIESGERFELKDFSQRRFNIKHTYTPEGKS